MMGAATKERPILFSGEMVRAILAGRKTMTRRVVKPQPDIVYHMIVQPETCCTNLGNVAGGNFRNCPFQVGMRLWIRETFAIESNRYLDVYDEPDEPLGPVRWYEDENGVRWIECPRYLASEPHTLLINDDDEEDFRMRWHPSIHMPRWASRLTLEVTGVRVERLQEITEEDAIAEGFEPIASVPWWQGYKDVPGMGLIQQQARGAEPPDWMIEPKPCGIRDPLAKTALSQFMLLWDRLNGPRGFGWKNNCWVWVVSFKSLEQ